MTVTIRHGDCREVLRTLPDASVHCCVTSPPYFGLRDYGHADQIGLEPTPEAFVAEMVAVFREVRRVLRDDGTLWLNLGDSYAGSWGARGRGKDTNAARPDFEIKHGTAAPARNGFSDEGIKPKDLIGTPWMVAFALRADGWYLRQDIIWHKPNPMPESVTDRCTKAHEYVFLLSKSPRYHYDASAIAEAGSLNEPWSTSSNAGSKAKTIRADGNHSGLGVSARKRGVPPRHDGLASSDRSGLDEVGRGGRRNRRSVWTIATAPFAEAHFATFPPALIDPCVLAGCPAGGTVLDPFGGAGTTGMVADRHGRNAILIELNPEYAAIADRRIRGDAGMFASMGASALTPHPDARSDRGGVA